MPLPALNALRTPFDFEGRAVRPDYWWFVLLMLAAQQVAIFTTFFGRVHYLLTFWILVFIVPYAAVLVRRLHDTHRSGWWAAPHVVLLTVGVIAFDSRLANFRDPGGGGSSIDGTLFMCMFAVNIVYVIYTIVIIVFAAQDGTSGPNSYGPDPKKRMPRA